MPFDVHKSKCEWRELLGSIYDLIKHIKVILHGDLGEYHLIPKIFIDAFNNAFIVAVNGNLWLKCMPEWEKGDIVVEKHEGH